MEEYPRAIVPRLDFNFKSLSICPVVKVSVEDLEGDTVLRFEAAASCLSLMEARRPAESTNSGRSFV